MRIDVRMDDKTVAVSCAGGEWHVLEINNPLIWLVQALERPDLYNVNVINERAGSKEYYESLEGKQSR